MSVRIAAVTPAPAEDCDGGAKDCDGGVSVECCEAGAGSRETVYRSARANVALLVRETSWSSWEPATASSVIGRSGGALDAPANIGVGGERQGPLWRMGLRNENSNLALSLSEVRIAAADDELPSS